MRSRCLWFFPVALSLALAAAKSAPSQPEPSVTGMFSDMRHIESEDDYVGSEVFIVMSIGEHKRKYFALVQFAEGAAEAPQLVDLTIDKDRVVFRATHPTGGAVQFVGRVTGEALVGRFEGLQSADEVSLPRRLSVWQR